MKLLEKALKTLTETNKNLRRVNWNHDIEQEKRIENLKKQKNGKQRII